MEKTYTLAEVNAMLEAERAKSTKATKVAWKVGVSKKTSKAYEGIQVSGDFFPVYLTPKACRAILGAKDAIEALLAQGPPAKVEAVDPKAPRLVTKAS